MQSIDLLRNHVGSVVRIFKTEPDRVIDLGVFHVEMHAGGLMAVQHTHMNHRVIDIELANKTAYQWSLADVVPLKEMISFYEK